MTTSDPTRPNSQLCFIHISDTHFNPDTDYIKSYAPYTPAKGMDALIDALRALPLQADFILHTGDVAYDPVPAVYPMIADRFAVLNTPIYYLAGNHDDSHALQTILMEHDADDVQEFLHYELDVNGVQIVCLDSNQREKMQDQESPGGYVPDDQLEWLDAICNADDPRPLVVAVHHNVLPVGVPWLDDWMRMENGAAFHDVVKQARDRIQGVFFGHIHQNVNVFKDGVLYSAAASSWCQFMSYPMPENDRVSQDPHTPPGFSVVTIQNGRTFIRRHTFAVDA